jgi:hypothetical protein
VLALQQFINANPVLAAVVIFMSGVVAFLAARILLANSGCLARVVLAVVIIIVILLLLRHMLLR